MDENIAVYHDVLAPLYDKLCDVELHGLTETDEGLYLEEARRTGGPVLDLGCGTGRIALPIAEAGFSVTGLEIAPAMLEVARQKARQRSLDVQQRLRFVDGDMCSFNLDQRFNLVIIPNGAFSHLLTPADQQQALRCICRHLTEKGRLVLTTYVLPEAILTRAQLPLGRQVRPLVADKRPLTGNSVALMGYGLRYDFERQWVKQEYSLEERDGAGNTLDVKKHEMVQYNYRPGEMQSLLHRCGYDVEAVYGDYQRQPVQAEGEQIWIAYKSLLDE